MELKVTISDKKYESLKKCKEAGMGLSAIDEAVLNGTPVKRGKWIYAKHRTYLARDVWAEYEIFGADPSEEYDSKEGTIAEMVLECSECHETPVCENITPFCPYCGSDNREETETEGEHD